MEPQLSCQLRREPSSCSCDSLLAHLCHILWLMTRGGVCLPRNGRLLCLGTSCGPKQESGTVCLGRDVGRAAPGWQAQGLAPGGRRDWLVTSSMEFFFFLAATGDVEEDGGLSDSIQTSKVIPVVCLWSSLPPSVPPTLNSLAGSSGWLSGGPRCHLPRASGQNCVPMATARGWGCCVSGGDIGLVGPHAGFWGLSPLAAGQSKRNRAERTPRESQSSGWGLVPALGA